MSKEEIEAKIKQYQSDQFLLMMKDTWTGEDFAQDIWYDNQIKKLNKELEEYGSED